MRLSRVALMAAAGLFVVAIAAAALGIRSTPPACPPGYVTVPDQEERVFRASPTYGPSRFDVVPLSQDRRWDDRGVVLAVGFLGSLCLLFLGLRLASQEDAT